MVTPRWEWLTPTRVVFGRGTAAELPPLTASLGQRVWLITGSSPARTAGLRDALAAHVLVVGARGVAHEPNLDLVASLAADARQQRADVIVAIGGGSVLDAGKAVAALVTNTRDPLDYVEVVGRGLPLEVPPLPVIAVPTTAGTGSEVTKNAVVSVAGRRVKVSLRHPLMCPRIALVDPALTVPLPPDVTAYSGLDALTQNIEPFLSKRAQPITDALCREGIRRVTLGLAAAYRDGTNLDAREHMCLASLSGGLALANAGLGAVHGLAGPIGGMFDAPHGAVCAALLPWVFETNWRALDSRAADHPARQRADEVARLLTGDPRAVAADGSRWLQRQNETLAVPGLRTWGIGTGDIAAIAEHSQRASSMAANPIPLTTEELADILGRAL